MVDARRVGLDGPVNVRDLGGYATDDGRTVRWGQVFRGDALGTMTAADRRRFETLGVRTIYDLRGPDERTELPDPMPSRSVEIGPGLPPQLLPTPDALRSEADGERWLADEYRWRLDHAAPAIGVVLTGLTADGALPALFHCAGGKDRTGLVAALLLCWLGIDREGVLDDYELSARFRTIETEGPLLALLLEHGVAPAAAEAFLGAPRWVMADALAHVDDRHGGVGRYLQGPAAMTAEALDALRRLLLVGGDQPV